MELNVLSLLPAFALLATLLFTTSLYKHLWAGFNCRKTPPGTTGWPIIGESLEFLASGWKGQPEKFILDRVSKYSSNIFTTSLFLERTVVLVGAEANRFLFTENKLVRPWWPRAVKKVFPTVPVGSEGAIRLKRMMSPLLQKSRGLESYIATIDAIAKAHFGAEWENKESVLVLPLAHKYTMALACKLFLNMEDPRQVEKIAGPISVLLRAIFSIPIDLPGTWFNKGVKAAEILRRELLAVAKQRKIDLSEKRGDSSPLDLMSYLMLATDESGKHMNELEVADNIMGMMIGGYNPTSVACALIVKYLAELPDIYHQVYQEQNEISKAKKEGELLDWNDLQKMRFSWNVACEVMRLTPPQQGGFREAIQDFEYQGYFIPKGCKLYWSAYATHMNPKYHPKPEKFDPSRFQGDGVAAHTYVPFGGGLRMCPGKEYSRLELLVFMHNLVTRFKFEKVIADEKIVLNPMPSPAKGLPVRLFPH